MSRVKIAEFATAIGEPSPLCRDRAAAQAAGYPDVIAPPTFAIVVTSAGNSKLMSDPDLGVNYAMVVHGEQSFTHARPLHAGDVVVAQSTIESIKQRPQHDHDGDGHRRSAPWTASTSARRDPPWSNAAHKGETMASPSYHDTQAGTEIAPRQYQVTRRDLVKYAGASGDFNVIHWNERIAKSVGLPDVIAHGMLTMALAGRYLTEWAGDPGAVTEFGVRFSSPVVVPDDDKGALVEIAGAVTGQLDGNQVTVEITARSGDAKVLTRAHAVVRLAAVPAQGDDPLEPLVKLADYTTVRLGGPARGFVRASTEEELIEAVRAADASGEPVLILGGGSNLVVADEGFDGTVIQVATRGVSQRRGPGRADRGGRRGLGRGGRPDRRRGPGRPGVPVRHPRPGGRHPDPERRRLRPGSLADDHAGARLRQEDLRSPRYPERAVRLRLPHQPVPGDGPVRRAERDLRARGAGPLGPGPLRRTGRGPRRLAR